MVPSPPHTMTRTLGTSLNSCSPARGPSFARLYTWRGFSRYWAGERQEEKARIRYILISVCVSVHLPVYLSSLLACLVYLSIYLFYLSVYLSSLSVCLSSLYVCLSICLSFYQSVCLHIHVHVFFHSVLIIVFLYVILS